VAVTLVTGGAGHLGQALASHFVEAGDDVHIVDQSPQVSQVAARLGCAGHQIDLTDEGGLAALAELAELDRLVCSVGAWPRSPWNQLSPKAWREVLATNLDSAYFSVRALTDALVKSSGSVVFVGSAIGLKGNPEMAHYAAAKAGLVGLAKSLALSLGPFGVRVNVVASGLIETPDADKTWTLEQREAMWQQRAMQRALTISEVVAPIVFLSSESASGITGQTLVVDGGVVFH
jgi:3-oxoacyl-[acyl-carrier protein] reductase